MANGINARAWFYGSSFHGNLSCTQDRTLFHLWNTETEQSEAQEFMTRTQADERNNSLRSLGEPQRWLPLKRVLEDLGI